MSIGPLIITTVIATTGAAALIWVARGSAAPTPHADAQVALYNALVDQRLLHRLAMERDGYRNVSFALGETLGLLARDERLDPDTQSACARALATQCALNGVAASRQHNITGLVRSR